MTHGAGLIFLRLVVERRRCRRARVCRECMAFQAQQVHLAALQQPRVRIPVRRMARRAPLELHRLMFKYEGSLLVRMAFEAHRILRTRRAQLPRLKSAMRIVAVHAFH